jgi:hypothetical protein
VLLLFAEGQPMQIPAKAFEYMFLGRRILAICDGATARLMSLYDGARVATSQDVSGIESALKIWASEIERGQPAPAASMESLAEYSADAVTAQLAKALNRLTDMDPWHSLERQDKPIPSLTCP